MHASFPKNSPDKLLAITSTAVLNMVDAGKITLYQALCFYNQSPGKLSAITSTAVLNMMNAGKITLDQAERFYDQSPEKLSAITSTAVLNMVDAGKITLDQAERIYDQSREQLEAVLAHANEEQTSLRSMLVNAVKVKRSGGNIEITTNTPKEMSQIIEQINDLKSPDTAIVPLGGSKTKIAIKNPQGELGQLLKTIISSPSRSV